MPENKIFVNVAKKCIKKRPFWPRVVCRWSRRVALGEWVFSSGDDTVCQAGDEYWQTKNRKGEIGDVVSRESVVHCFGVELDACVGDFENNSKHVTSSWGIYPNLSLYLY